MAYRKLFNRGTCFYLIFEFWSVLLFKTFEILCSKNSVKSLFACFYWRRATIWSSASIREFTENSRMSQKKAIANQHSKWSSKNLKNRAILKDMRFSICNMFQVFCGCAILDHFMPSNNDGNGNITAATFATLATEADQDQKELQTLGQFPIKTPTFHSVGF